MPTTHICPPTVVGTGKNKKFTQAKGNCGMQGVTKDKTPPPTDGCWETGGTHTWKIVPDDYPGRTIAAGDVYCKVCGFFITPPAKGKGALPKAGCPGPYDTPYPSGTKKDHNWKKYP